MISIHFLEPDRLHTGSDNLTTAELAYILEKKYKLIDRFTKSIKNKLYQRVEVIISRNMDKPTKWEFLFNRDLSGWLQNEWREFINKGNYGVITKSSQKRGTQPFVDTGDYFKSLKVKIEII